MELLERLLANAPDDPLLLALGAVALWLPLCALGLLGLVLLATLQNFLRQHRRPATAIVLPPSELRPLAGRRIITGAPRAHGLLSIGRLVLAVIMVMVSTAVFLMMTRTWLLNALPG
ncbi:MAG: hypothetical protein HY332_01340 [Chloroflexi bacterium]|nr:hypothetical protein [Chloroflexota bacterium]